MLFSATLESGGSQINFDRNLKTFRKNLDFELIYGKTPQSASMKFSKQLGGDTKGTQETHQILNSIIRFSLA
jgi:hypothetical protein